MLGLMYLTAAILYLAAMFFSVRSTWRWGRSRGASRSLAFSLSFVVFLAVYHAVFWNWIPSVLAHREACARDAGFKVYVEPETWRQTNRSELASLHGIDTSKTTEYRHQDNGFSRYEFFGGLLGREHQLQKSSKYGLMLWRIESRIVDAKTNQVLTARINYGVGDRDDARIWLTRTSCFPPSVSPLDLETAYLLKLKSEIK